MISAEIQGLTKGFESIEERARMSHDMVQTKRSVLSHRQRA